ncbi:hypothetical protein [uncultured Kordia sp.]|uniref:hypothetical protein n=1 Tax=uncultured Kordia sp. TaxID=507699 RepID=UPI00263340BA|nr:hypothetical protein [uncultured Kordia sp.]
MKQVEGLVSCILSIGILFGAVLLDTKYQVIFTTVIVFVLLLIAMIVAYRAKKKQIVLGIGAAFLFIIFLFMFIIYDLSRLH